MTDLSYIKKQRNVQYKRYAVKIIRLSGGIAFRNHSYVFQLFVGCRMVRHEVELLVERGASAFAAHFTEDAAGGSLDYPFGSIVEARGISVHLAVSVAQAPQIVYVFLECRFGFLCRESHCEAHLHEEDAVGLAGVHRQPLGLLFQGPGDIGRSEEVLGDLDYQFTGRKVAVAGYEVHYFLKILHVLLGETRIAFFKGGGAQDEPEQGGDKYDDTFHNQKKASL